MKINDIEQLIYLFKKKGIEEDHTLYIETIVYGFKLNNPAQKKQQLNNFLEKTEKLIQTYQMLDDETQNKLSSFMGESYMYPTGFFGEHIKSSIRKDITICDYLETLFECSSFVKDGENKKTRKNEELYLVLFNEWEGLSNFYNFKFIRSDAIKFISAVIGIDENTISTHIKRIKLNYNDYPEYQFGYFCSVLKLKENRLQRFNINLPYSKTVIPLKYSPKVDKDIRNKINLLDKLLFEYISSQIE